MSTEPQVSHDPNNRNFYVELEGSRATLGYMDLGSRTLDFYRTFVPVALRGKGIAALLADQALAWAHGQGYKVIPSCSYIERFMQRRAGRSSSSAQTSNNLQTIR
ncbi:MAG: N-acetyltransferase [Halopseudomonas yangmingensis]